MTTRRLDEADAPLQPEAETAPASRFIPPRAEWDTVVARSRALAPEAFDASGRVLNVFPGAAGVPAVYSELTSPVDGRTLGELPMMDERGGLLAIDAARREGDRWRARASTERQRQVEACLDELAEHRELLALLLAWEIGKPYRQGLTEVDRTLDGVRWYLETVPRMLVGREPLGLVANVASWNYPLSVLFHTVMVQALAGNAAIAKVPTKGGLHVLTVAFAIARRHGLPLSLVSGPGGSLGRVLTEADAVAGVVFVGGRENGMELAHRVGASKRTMIEMEGVNAYGLWDFSDWAMLDAHLKKSFEYAKQRCTAYTRFVVQRSLFPRFLEHYLATVATLQVGNPLAVQRDTDPLPDLDFGPLIDARAAEELDTKCEETLAGGAAYLFEGGLSDEHFVPRQDRSAYLAPRALLGVPRSSALYQREPFGPVDSIVLVDSHEQLVNEMNVSGGALVATVASDDPALAKRIARDVAAFKVGINELRSRGDRDEPFGGFGRSWSGAFVGGELLVEAVTDGPGLPAGNYDLD